MEKWIVDPKGKSGKVEHVDICLGSGSERHLYSVRYLNM